MKHQRFSRLKLRARTKVATCEPHLCKTRPQVCRVVETESEQLRYNRKWSVEGPDTVQRVTTLLRHYTSRQKVEEHVDGRLILQVWIIDNPMDHSDGQFLEPQKMEYVRTMTTSFDVDDLGMGNRAGI